MSKAAEAVKYKPPTNEPPSTMPRAKFHKDFWDGTLRSRRRGRRGVPEQYDGRLSRALDYINTVGASSRVVGALIDGQPRAFADFQAMLAIS